jgi:sugar lactone lactonase YvrE
MGLEPATAGARIVWKDPTHRIGATMRQALLACLALLPAGAAAQTDSVLASRAEYRDAVAAYRTHDYKAFLEHARRAEALRPSHGGVIYALASAYALTDHASDAMATLQRFASLGYFADVSADSDFIALRTSPGFTDIRRALAANRAPVVRSTVAFTLPEKDLLTEGIAHDPRSGSFFVGSVHRRKIFRVDRAGRVTEFATHARDSLWAPFGMKVDTVRGSLWVAVAAVPQMEAFRSDDAGRSGLLRFDLAAGRLTGRFLIPPDGQIHGLGDLTIAANGDVYSSDSRVPAVWRVQAGTDSLERFLESPLFIAPQGLDLTPDGRTLYLADYSRGILRIDLATRAVTPLSPGAGVVALGIDGLYLTGGRLVGIQNGVEPHRVLRFTLDADADSLVASEVLERAHPRYSEPTLGVVWGPDLYYVANSQWERFGETGTIAHPDQLERPTILRLRL